MTARGEPCYWLWSLSERVLSPLTGGKLGLCEHIPKRFLLACDRMLGLTQIEATELKTAPDKL